MTGKVRFLIFLLIIAVCGALVFGLSRYNLLPEKSYSAEELGIETVHSSVDFNENGIDDYTDIMLGARADAENKPKYDGAYQEGGYPPEDIGVCTDVVWRAFKNAGYCLRAMVDNDINKFPESYPNIKKADSNIDFRRVPNLHIFFEKYAVALTTNTENTSEWQAGDIVIFGNDKHIGIVSDKRNKNGRPYIIHNGGQPNREEDYLKRGSVSAHYRFDASRISSDILVKWN